MRIFIISTIMLFSILGFSQKKNPLSITKQQAQQLIIEKLKEHSYKSKIDGVKKDYVISFNDSMMVIYNLTEGNNYYMLKIADIDSLSIEEKDYSVSLSLKLAKDKQITNFIHPKLIDQPLGVYEFILNLSFLNEDLPEKIGDAFRRLTSFYD